MKLDCETQDELKYSLRDCKTQSAQERSFKKLIPLFGTIMFKSDWAFDPLCTKERFFLKTTKFIINWYQQIIVT